MATQAGQLFRALPIEPALETDPRLSPGFQLELLPDIGSPNHLPGITRRLGGMDDDRARRTLPGSAGVFIVPAAVGQFTFTSEQLRVPVGIVVEHQQDLAFQVGAFEIVPVLLGRLDAVTDKNHLGVRYRNVGLLDSGHDHVLIRVSEAGGRAVCRGEAQVRGVADRQAYDIHCLFVRVPFKQGCETHLRQAAGQEFPGFPVALAAGPAALELVAGDDTHIAQKVRGLDGLFCRIKAGREMEHDRIRMVRFS